jgi:hypothetical protein
VIGIELTLRVKVGKQRRWYPHIPCKKRRELLILDLEDNGAMVMTDIEIAYSFHKVCSPFIYDFTPNSILRGAVEIDFSISGLHVQISDYA